MRTFMAFSFLLFFYACGASAEGAGGEFIGKWQNLRNPPDQFEIMRNGTNFIIQVKEPFAPGGIATQLKAGMTMGASLRDGQLIVQVLFGPVAITHVIQNDTLLVAGNLYKRLK